MSFPVLVDNLVPANNENPGLGAARIRAVAQFFLDLFGIPNEVNITGPIMGLGANTDGKIATAPVLKAASPFHRLIGTEASAKDVRIAEDGGLVKFQHNTGSEATPVWTDRVLIDMATGTITKGSEFAGGGVTKMLFKQAAAPTGWTRVVDAANTDAVLRVVQNGEVPGAAGSWTITGLIFTGDPHYHQQGNFVADTNGAQGGSDNAFGADAAGSPQVNAASATVALQSSRPRTSQVTVTGSVVGNGAWRPKYVDVIAASKD